MSGWIDFRELDRLMFNQEEDLYIRNSYAKKLADDSWCMGILTGLGLASLLGLLLWWLINIFG